MLDRFTLNEVIPSGRHPTTILAQLMKNGNIYIPIKTYRLNQIVEADRDMEETLRGAKMVVLVD